MNLVYEVFLNLYVAFDVLIHLYVAFEFLHWYLNCLCTCIECLQYLFRILRAKNASYPYLKWYEAQSIAYSAL